MRRIIIQIVHYKIQKTPPYVIYLFLAKSIICIVAYDQKNVNRLTMTFSPFDNGIANYEAIKTALKRWLYQTFKSYDDSFNFRLNTEKSYVTKLFTKRKSSIIKTEMVSKLSSFFGGTISFYCHNIFGNILAHARTIYLLCKFDITLFHSVAI